MTPWTPVAIVMGRGTSKAPRGRVSQVSNAHSATEAFEAAESATSEAHTAWESAMSWVLDVSETHSDMAVLLAIMIHPGGVALTRTLAEKAKVSRKTVLRAVKRLEGRGLMTIYRNPGSASYYSPNSPVAWPVAA